MSADDEGVLWDVVEEHFEEAAYGLGQFQRSLQSPVLGLKELARHPEWRLLAHVDALAVGGTVVREKLLLPALDAADPSDPCAAMVAAWVLLESGAFTALLPALAHESAGVRGAFADVARLASNPALDAWLQQTLASPAQDAPLAGLLELCAARQLSPPTLLAWLQSEDVTLVEAAARAARFGDSSTYLPILQHLLDHTAPGVREAALLACLGWGSQHAWLHCQTWALDPAQPSALATQLYAALATRAEQARLVALLDVPEARQSVLSVLGLTGDIELRTTLLPLLASKAALEPKLAAQALGMIFGFLPGDYAYGLYDAPPEVPDEDADAAEAAAALPALEDDDLEADLVPAPAEALPTPNPVTIAAFCVERAAKLAPGKRALFGAEASPSQVAQVFNVGPLGWHHAIALALGVRSGGSVWLDTRALTAARRRQVVRAVEATWKRHVAF